MTEKEDWFYIKLNDKLGNYIGDVAGKLVDAGGDKTTVYLEKESPVRTIFEMDRHGAINYITGRRDFQKRAVEVIFGLESVLLNEHESKENAVVAQKIMVSQYGPYQYAESRPDLLIGGNSEKIFDYVRSAQSKNRHFSVTVPLGAPNNKKGWLLVNLESIEHRGNLDGVFIGYYIQKHGGTKFIDWVEIDNKGRPRHWMNTDQSTLDDMLQPVLEAITSKSTEQRSNRS